MKLSDMWNVARTKPEPTYRPQAVTTPSSPPSMGFGDASHFPSSSGAPNKPAAGWGFGDANHMPGYTPPSNSPNLGFTAPNIAGRPPFMQWLRQAHGGILGGDWNREGGQSFRDFMTSMRNEYANPTPTGVLPHEQGPSAVPGMIPVDSMPWLKHGNVTVNDGNRLPGYPPNYNTGIVPPNLNGGHLPNEQGPPAVSSYQGLPPNWW